MRLRQQDKRSRPTSFLAAARCETATELSTNVRSRDELPLQHNSAPHRSSSRSRTLREPNCLPFAIGLAATKVARVDEDESQRSDDYYLEARRVRFKKQIHED